MKEPSSEDKTLEAILWAMASLWISVGIWQLFGFWWGFTALPVVCVFIAKWVSR